MARVLGRETPAGPTPSGSAHVSTVSFLASRASPVGGFFIALAGGATLARAALRRGLRSGYGASVAAMLETVAIMGPARFGVPLTQAVSAPVLGRLEARGWPSAAQVVACAGIRLAHNSATTAFFIFVITGGLDAYAGTYEAVAERVGLSAGTGFALLVTGAGLLAWGAFASTVQVLIYRRAMRSVRRGPEEAAPVGGAGPREEAARAGGAGEPARAVDAVQGPAGRRRFDPRAVALAAAIAFALLLASTEWIVLGASAAWLAVAVVLARGDRSAVSAGAVLAILLGGAAFAFSFVGGLGLDVALRRMSRAAMLVAVATWLRSAAGSVGLREVSRRALGRLRRLPAMTEAAAAMDDLTSERRLSDAGRALLRALRPVPKRPLPIVDTVLTWASAEAAGFRSAPRAAPLALRARLADALLVAAAFAPLAAILAA